MGQVQAKVQTTVPTKNRFNSSDFSSPQKNFLRDFWQRKHRKTPTIERDDAIITSMIANRNSLSYNWSNKKTRTAADELLLEQAVEAARFSHYPKNILRALKLANELCGPETVAEVANHLLEKSKKFRGEPDSAVFTAFSTYAIKARTDRYIFEKASEIGKALLNDPDMRERAEKAILLDPKYSRSLDAVFDLLYSLFKNADPVCFAPEHRTDSVRDRIFYANLAAERKENAMAEITSGKGNYLLALADLLEKDNDAKHPQKHEGSGFELYSYRGGRSNAADIRFAAARAFRKSARHYQLADHSHNVNTAAQKGLAAIELLPESISDSVAVGKFKVALLNLLADSTFKELAVDNSSEAHEILLRGAEFCYKFGIDEISKDGLNLGKMKKSNLYFLEQARLFAIASGNNELAGKVSDILIRYSAYCELNGRAYALPSLVSVARNAHRPAESVV